MKTNKVARAVLCGLKLLRLGKKKDNLLVLALVEILKLDNVGVARAPVQDLNLLMYSRSGVPVVFLNNLGTVVLGFLYMCNFSQLF